MKSLNFQETVKENLSIKIWDFSVDDFHCHLDATLRKECSTTWTLEVGQNLSFVFNFVKFMIKKRNISSNLKFVYFYRKISSIIIDNLFTYFS